MLPRIFIIILGLIGGAGFSQGPEVATQYQQRLGGAIDELEKVVRRFDDDATKNGLSRIEALERMTSSSDPLVQDRGQSMEIATSRYDSLLKQIDVFNGASEFYKPFYLLMSADTEVLTGAMEDFSPGVPITFGGIFYAVIGFIATILIPYILRLLFRPFSRKRAPDAGVTS